MGGKNSIGPIALGISMIISGTALLLMYTAGSIVKIKISLVFVGVVLSLIFEYRIKNKGSGNKARKKLIVADGKSIAALLILVCYLTLMWPQNNEINTVYSGDDTSKEDYKYSLSNEYHYFEENCRYKRLFLDNEIGDIMIKDSQDASFRMEAKVYINTNDEEKVKKFLESPISIEKSQNIIVRAVDSIIPEEIASKPKINYIMYIPKNTDVEIKGGHGNITIAFMESDVLIKKNNGNIKVSLIKGNVEITNSNGRVDLNDIQGSVIVNNQHGRITAYSITGAGSFKTTFKNIEIEKIGGPTKVDTTNATVSVIDVHSDVDVATTFGRAELSDIKGNIIVKNNNGDVFVSRIEGKIDIHTSFGAVKIDEAYRDVRAITSHGDIIVTLDKELSSDYHLETIYSDIYFFSPKLTNGKINIFTTEYGIVEGDYELDIVNKGNEIFSHMTFGKGEYKVNMKNICGSVFLRVK